MRSVPLSLYYLTHHPSNAAHYHFRLQLTTKITSYWTFFINSSQTFSAIPNNIVSFIRQSILSASASKFKAAIYSCTTQKKRKLMPSFQKSVSNRSIWWTGFPPKQTAFIARLSSANRNLFVGIPWRRRFLHEDFRGSSAATAASPFFFLPVRFPLVSIPSKKKKEVKS